jgi:hypothetical protein
VDFAETPRAAALRAALAEFLRDEVLPAEPVAA